MENCKDCKYFEKCFTPKIDFLGVCWHRESDHLYHVLHQFHYKCGFFDGIEYKCKACGWLAMAGQAYKLSKNNTFNCPKCDSVLEHITI